MHKTILLTATLALFLGGCAEMDSKPAAAPAASNSALSETIASAEKEIAAAKKSGGLWLQTEQFLADAKEAQAAGKDEEAMKLAKKALKQAQLAQKQAQSQANAKPHFN